MKEKRNFENSLRYSRIALQLSGVDISSQKLNRGFIGFIKPWIIYINMFWMYPDLVGEIYWTYSGFKMGKSFLELSIVAPCAIIAIMSNVKIMPLYFNVDKLLNIIDKFRKIHPNVDEGVKDNVEDIRQNPIVEGLKENVEDIEKEIVKEAVKFLNQVVVFMYYACGAVMVLFTTTPIFSMLYDYYSSGTTELKYPFPIKYFFFDSFVVSRFPFIYVHQAWSSFICCFNVYGTDSLFYVFCTYLQMHFRLLCHRFENAVSETSMEETRANFRKAVKRHQELIELVNQIESLYTKSTLCNILCSSLLICLSGFNITFIDDKAVVVSFITFFIMSLSQIFLLCFFGDMLSTSSNEVYQAVYNCKWYDTQQSIKRSVLLVMIRAQTPCKLTAMNFVELNLPAFTTILSRSWSYFTLLNTFFD